MVINLTPHEVAIFHVDEAIAWNSVKRWYDVITEPKLLEIFPPSGKVARCQQKEIFCDRIDGIPVLDTVYGEVENLPPPCKDTWYIVSRYVANAAREQGRTDLLVPTRMIRAQDGNIIGCTALSKR